MSKLVVLSNDKKVKFWENIGQSPSAIHMAGLDYLGTTNEYSTENLEKMQADVDTKECFNYGDGALRDWAIAKYNLG